MNKENAFSYIHFVTHCTIKRHGWVHDKHPLNKWDIYVDNTIRPPHTTHTHQKKSLPKWVLEWLPMLQKAGQVPQQAAPSLCVESTLVCCVAKPRRRHIQQELLQQETQRTNSPWSERGSGNLRGLRERHCTCRGSVHRWVSVQEQKTLVAALKDEL